MTKKTLQDWKMTMAEKSNDAEYERIIKEIRYNRQMQRKRMYEQVARARKAESSPQVKKEPNEGV